jgi:hypothetical protein
MTVVACSMIEKGMRTSDSDQRKCSCPAAAAAMAARDAVKREKAESIEETSCSDDEKRKKDHQYLQVSRVQESNNSKY